MSVTVESLLDITLGLGNARYDVLHSATKGETKKKRKQKLVAKVRKCYTKKKGCMGNFNTYLIKRWRIFAQELHNV